MQMLTEAYNLLARFHEFMLGSTFALNMIIALIFLRFYCRTRDRLFVLFSASFAILGLNRLVFMVIYTPEDPRATLQYVIRLVAFGLIIYAIVDKNRRRTVSRGAGS